MKLAICDDDKDIRNYMEKCVREVAPDLEILRYPDAGELLKGGTEADIILMDIQMPGIDGMKAARILRTAGSKAVIVFVTALTDPVFQAFDVDAAGYIVKPFDRRRLTETIRKAISAAEKQKTVDDILAAGGENSGSSRSLVVRCGGVNTRVILSDIAYAEVFDRRIVLHMADTDGHIPSGAGRQPGAEARDALTQISYYGRMTELEHIAGSDFFRVHRAYLINLKYVTSYDSRSVCVLGDPVPVARGKYPELVKQYMAYYTRLERL